MSTASDFVANLQKLSFFCLETKERNKEKFKTDFFSPTHTLHYAKGQKLASLKQSALFNASLRVFA